MNKNPFDYQKPTDEQVKAIEAARGACKATHALLSVVTPPSRERALAFQKLEEFSMWANKAIVFNGAQNVGGPMLGPDFSVPGEAINQESKDEVPSINLD